MPNIQIPDDYPLTQTVDVKKDDEYYRVYGQFGAYGTPGHPKEQGYGAWNSHPDERVRASQKPIDMLMKSSAWREIQNDAVANGGELKLTRELITYLQNAPQSYPALKKADLSSLVGFRIRFGKDRVDGHKNNIGQVEKPRMGISHVIPPSQTDATVNLNAPSGKPHNAFTHVPKRSAAEADPRKAAADNDASRTQKTGSLEEMFPHLLSGRGTLDLRRATLKDLTDMYQYFNGKGDTEKAKQVRKVIDRKVNSLNPDE